MAGYDFSQVWLMARASHRRCVTCTSGFMNYASRFRNRTVGSRAGQCLIVQYPPPLPLLLSSSGRSLYSEPLESAVVLLAPNESAATGLWARIYDEQ